MNRPKKRSRPAARFFQARMEVSTPDCFHEKRVSGKERHTVKHVAGAFSGMSGRMHRSERSSSEVERIAIAHRRKTKRDTLLLRQEQRGAAQFRQPARTRQMVGVDMRFQDARDSPPTTSRQLEIDLGWEGSVDHQGGSARANQVG